MSLSNWISRKQRKSPPTLMDPLETKYDMAVYTLVTHALIKTSYILSVSLKNVNKATLINELVDIVLP